MSDVLGYLLLSIPFIGAYAMFALGITVIHRASRVLNLAHGAMAMIPAYIMYSAVQRGIPVPLALPLAVASGALLGVAVERVFVRRLRAQGPTAQTVGTVAVTGVLIALAAKIWGTTPHLAPQVFPRGVVRVAGSALRYGDLGLFGTGVAVSLALFAFFRFTKVGLAMRGAAENRQAAALMGIDPDRTAAAAWALGGGLAALAGVLLAAVTELDPYNLSFEVLPAFVAALLGGLDSLAGGLIGSVVAGLVFSVVPLLRDAPLIGPVMRYSGAPQLVLAVLAMVTMAVRGRRFAATDGGEARLAAGARTAPSSRPARSRTGLALGVAAVCVVLTVTAPYSLLGDALLAVEFALAAISVVVLTGWVGQISLAQASFVGISALVTGLVVRGWGIGFPANLALSAAVAGVAAVVLGMAALRVRGLYLAVATLIFAWMVDSFLVPGPWLGADGGSSTIDAQHLGNPGGFPFVDLSDRRALLVVMVAVLVLVVFTLANLRDTRAGRAFFAVRGSEVAAVSLGIDVVRYKLIAFAVAGVVAGIAGNLLMVEQRTVVPAQFVVTVSLEYLAIAVVGGLGSLGGAVAAGAVFAGLHELFFRVSALAGWLDVVSAGLLAAVLLLYPGGLAALPDALRGRWDPVSTRLKAVAEQVRSAVPRVPRPLRTQPADTDWLAAQQRQQPAPARAQGSPASPTVPALTLALPASDSNGEPQRTREQRDIVLDARNVTVRFGGLTAVDDASIEVRDGEVVGLIGPNGAGKTTLFNAVLGLNQPASGRVLLHGADVTGMAPHLRARAGVARTFQVLQLFRELTVFDNVLVATHLHNHAGLLSNLLAMPTTLHAERRLRERVGVVLQLLRLDAVAGRPVQGLPFGTLRMVELARALVTGARLVMLDEPASGLNEQETDRLTEVLRGVRALGVSVLLIEHDVRMVAGVSDHVYMLDQGRMCADGPPDAVQRDPRVVAAYLGRAAAGVA